MASAMVYQAVENRVRDRSHHVGVQQERLESKTTWLVGNHVVRLPRGRQATGCDLKDKSPLVRVLGGHGGDVLSQFDKVGGVDRFTDVWRPDMGEVLVHERVDVLACFQQETPACLEVLKRCCESNPGDVVRCELGEKLATPRRDALVVEARVRCPGAEPSAEYIPHQVQDEVSFARAERRVVTQQVLLQLVQVAAQGSKELLLRRTRRVGRANKLSEEGVVDDVGSASRESFAEFS
jgi:hypothetical protein